MKALALILILLSLSLSALAQTQTNCQVYGNQINCTSTSPPVMPPIQPIQPPQSSISPELIKALAEKRSQEFAAAEAARQAAVRKFEAELSAPDVWTSLTTGNQYHVRMTNDRIYMQKVLSPQAPEGTYASRECSTGNNEWTCEKHLHLAFPKRDWAFGCDLRPQGCWKLKWCDFEDTDKVTFVSLERIELEGYEPDGAQDYDSAKCTIKHKTLKKATLIPRQVPKP